MQALLIDKVDKGTIFLVELIKLSLTYKILFACLKQSVLLHL